jgi:ABC-2 type transport system permease protein
LDLDLNLTGLKAIMRLSVRKLLLSRRWVIVVLVGALVALVMGYVASQEVGSLDGGSTLLNSLVLSFLLPIMALIYGASMIRNEIDDRSITQIITSPVDRRVSYLGYYLSLVTVLSIMLLATGVVGWASYFLQTNVASDALDMLVSYSALLIIGSIVYSTLFLALGALLKQPIYLGLLYAFIWEGFVGSLPGAIGTYTIVHNLKVIGADLVHNGNITTFSGDATTAALILVFLTAVLLIIGAWAFREKEVP